MIEKFNNIYYLLIYVIHFAGIGIYAFQTIFRTRQFCTKFEIDDISSISNLVQNCLVLKIVWNAYIPIPAKWIT